MIVVTVTVAIVTVVIVTVVIVMVVILTVVLMTVVYVQKQVLLGNKVAGHNENSKAFNMLGRKTLIHLI